MHKHSTKIHRHGDFDLVLYDWHSVYCTTGTQCTVRLALSVLLILIPVLHSDGCTSNFAIHTSTASEAGLTLHNIAHNIL